MRVGRLLGTLALLVVGAIGAWAWGRTGEGGAGAAPPVQGAEVPRLVPTGTRIRVEVINTTTVRGQARRVTLYLRDAGFDVVKFAGEGPPLDSTVVIDRTGHPAWAELASKALGGAAIEVRPDSSRYVDLTVLVGRIVRTPPEAFYP